MWGCCDYLRRFFTNKDMVVMASLLMKELSMALVAAALEALNPSSSPGFDGIPTAVYKAFASHFTSLMFGIVRIILSTGALNPEWSLALFNPIPKARGIVKADKLRPPVRQTTCHKWVASILGLQLKDLATALTPSYQKDLYGVGLSSNIYGRRVVHGPPYPPDCSALLISAQPLTL